VLRRLEATGALFLGCRLDPADEDSLRDRGALIFPEVPDVPFDPYRTTLYDAHELYEGLEAGYPSTPDARIYAWSRRTAAGTSDVTAALARSLHDHAIDEALRAYVAGSAVLGVMGGHATARDSRTYADAARLGRAAARAGLLVATGGGPGAMEAANLGAAARDLGDAELTATLSELGRVPDFRPSVEEWARAAFRAGDRLAGDVKTLGIPTWFYGHEPPNAFAAGVAKYFRNALREDTLLHVCTAGIVFLPGSAGTVQELFQDACENFYAEDAARAPMVLLGEQHWTRTYPVWPLLRALADSAGFSSQVALVDSWEEAVDVLTG
jgi:predicted Rossmann-fold nucleotide-binding protein